MFQYEIKFSGPEKLSSNRVEAPVSIFFLLIYLFANPEFKQTSLGFHCVARVVEVVAS